MKGRENRVCAVCVQATEMLMPLLRALSSTLSISVYNVIRGKSLQLREAWRQATAWGRQEPRVYWSDLERPAGVSFLILTVVEDKLTSWWSHCVWCHKIRATHWQEFHHQSCSLTLLLTSGNSGFFCCLNIEEDLLHRSVKLSPWHITAPI